MARSSLLQPLAIVSATLLLAVPVPAHAQGETLVPFTDLPANINLTPTPERRIS